MPKMATDSEMTAQTTSTMNQRGNYSRNNNSSKTFHCGLEFISWFSFMHLMKELRAYKHGCTLIKKTWPRDHVTTWPLRVDVAACNSNLRNGSRYLIIRRPKGCGFYTFPPPTPSKERRRTQLFLRFLFLVSFCSIIFCCFIFLLLLHFFCCCFCCCCWSPFPLPSGNSSVVRWPFRLWFSEWRGCITAASSSRAESSERHLHSVTVTNSAAFDPPADWSFSLPLIWMNPAQHCDQLPILTDSGFRNANPPENHFYESRIRHQ